MPQYKKYPNESKEDFKKRMAEQQIAVQQGKMKKEADDFFLAKSKSQVGDIQDWLSKNPSKENPYYTGKLDSIPGPKTKEAYMRYRQDFKTAQEHSMDKLKKGGLIGTRGRALVDSITDYIKKLRN